FRPGLRPSLRVECRLLLIGTETADEFDGDSFVHRALYERPAVGSDPFVQRRDHLLAAVVNLSACDNELVGASPHFGYWFLAHDRGVDGGPCLRAGFAVDVHAELGLDSADGLVESHRTVPPIGCLRSAPTLLASFPS